MPPPIDQLRHDALRCLQAGIAAVRGRARVRELLARDIPESPLYLVAVGKAASDMTRGALEACGDRLAAGLVITKHGHLDPGLIGRPRLECLEAGHPVPDAASLEAGARLVAFVEAAPHRAQLLFLVSGGASSLVEVLPDGVTLADLVRLNQWLLASGLNIEQMNAARSALSCIKAGRLARRLGRRGARALLLSDVRGDDPAVIGSGLLVPGSAGAQAELPAWARALAGAAPSRPGPEEVTGVQVHIVARLSDALEGAGREARALGYSLNLHDNFVDGDAAAAGEGLARALIASPAGAHLWGGETTVRLPAQPGRGGRCQHLSLAAARVLAGRSGTVLLAAGTDGSDGPGEDAGAVIDGATLQRGAAQGLDAERCLRAVDAGTFLEASGDLVQTGPTGTNVMDVIIGLTVRPGQSQ
ncbi:MAG: DUF4147 domain-containing protein [Gammaproteobacteria bacterium]|nr:DUF4147 domain-containing protein [Gammaproteobacteria bacterium]NIR96955.1 DUF4147 domain-containing protein [Gammaproteobacteria bacterium]NIT62657.1 DUF4147 domain-containing protein [Gammaproteobacteria bacterium]NIV19617.1 DUF4147 domain-containing protein [Gammaproteobacteria bacterium]NIX10837.1 DUF4147 domain-containing protein [Gammaproteobacteria bacterium]